MANIFRRAVDGRAIEDSHTIDNIEHNSQAGARKDLDVGPALRYLGDTDTALAIPRGAQLFIFKTDAGLGWIKFGEDASVGAPSGSPADAEFPVFGQEFTKYSAGNYTHIRGGSTIHVYQLIDETRFSRNHS